MLGILGTTALLLDSGPDDGWGSPKERAVLATLVANAGRVVPVKTLVEWVWPEDSAPHDPKRTCHAYATRVRWALDRLPSPPTLRCTQGGYRLEIDQSRIDLHQFRGVLAEARKHIELAPDRAIDLVEGAIWLWRGEPLADLTTEPARAWRQRVLRTDWLAAHTLRIEALIGLDRFDDALAALDEVQEDFPDDVTLAEQRLTALYGGHRIADAITYFFTTWHHLRDAGDEDTAKRLAQHHTALATGQPDPISPQATTVPRQLPHDVRDFVGRRQQFAALDHACAEPTGVVLLHGPGGVGKTTLAMHWAHRRRFRYPDGDLYVDLGGHQDRAALDAVVDDFLTALGQPPDPALTRRQRELLLSSLLSGQRTLVVLDNAPDTEHVRSLVTLLSSCQVIVTSRHRLTKLRAARRIAVPPMPADDATRLLTLQTHGDVPDAARLVDLCWGIPLMIAILADDLSNRPAAQRAEFAARLDRRRRLVAVDRYGDDDPPCLISSYRRLAAPERRLFRLLALHPGPGVSAEAASACDGRPLFATLRSLEILVRAHLVQQPDELDRFRVHDLLAEFTTHRLYLDEPPGTRDAARVRMLDFYVASATEAAHTAYPDYPAPTDGPADQSPRFAGAAEALSWLHRERTNLTAAVRAAHEASCHDQVWRLTDPVAFFLDRSGCTAEGRDLRELAVQAARAVGHRAGETTALIGLGLAHLTLDDQESARQALVTALRIADEIGLASGLTSALHALGRLAAREDDPIEALEFFHRGLVAAEKVDDRHSLSRFHHDIGSLLRTIDRRQEAITHLWQARWEAQRAGDKLAESISLTELGRTFRELGDCDRAEHHYLEALAISETVPDLALSARICVRLCGIDTRRRRFEQAVDHGRRAVELLRGSQDMVSQAQAAEILGDALYAAGEPAEAAQVWRRAADRFDHIGTHGAAIRVHAKIDNTHAAQERTVPFARGEAIMDPPHGNRDIHLGLT
ncbi:AfsR/SARP family transcriptional regulator [Actinophytocola sp.]|uniref:AfsR/SARP family transcriptional regulator n=1 Tax=Actinophytocola sp. TaxID=1872138 RepID=UPI002ED1CB29